MSKHLVFVYGTLRQGGGRAMPDRFPGSEFVGGASVRGRLYDLGAYPGLLPDEAGGAVAGEVYEVDEETLGRMDEFEASSFYWRQRIDVALDGRSAECWVYAPSPDVYTRLAPIPSGDWVEYAKTKTDWPRNSWPDES